MSKQHCPSNWQLCCLLLRHCCWCGRGLRLFCPGATILGANIQGPLSGIQLGYLGAVHIRGRMSRHQTFAPRCDISSVEAMWGSEFCLSLQFSEARSLNTTEICSRVADSIDRLLSIRSKFVDDPPLRGDLNQLLRICEHWTFLCLTVEQTASTRSLSNDLLRLWNITDLLLNSSSTLTDVEDFSRYCSCQRYFPI